MTTKKAFKLYDILEGQELLGEFDTRQEVAKACNKRDNETDGECQLALVILNESNKYQRVNSWTYNQRTVTITEI